MKSRQISGLRSNSLLLSILSNREKKHTHPVTPRLPLLLFDSDTSLWDWQFDEPLPLNQLPSNHFIPSNDDLFLGYLSLCLSLSKSLFLSPHRRNSFSPFFYSGLSVPDETEAPFNVPHNEKDEQKKEERAITFEEVSRYFDVPISVAAKELNTGLTQLKKKCRELGIPRWPHRRIKSLHALIINVQVC